jgi:Tau and MAP protein, tubulin-binding repeat
VNSNPFHQSNYIMTNITSKVGSKENISHKPGGGDKKIATQSLDFASKATSKVGSKENISHKYTNLTQTWWR